jgi:hypothetical protein
MRFKQQSRKTLELVSYIFLLVGLLALGQMIHHAVQGLFRFNFGVLGIAIFAGLRRYSPAWRVCALVFIWYSMITVAVALGVCFYAQSPVNTLIADDRQYSSWFSIGLPVALVMMLFVTLWQYRVLTHPAIRRLFMRETVPLAALAATPMREEIEELEEVGAKR